MERKELDVLSEESNFAIVRMPGRNFPGCVVQGDSLCILYHRALDVLSRVKTTHSDSELIDDATELVEMLGGRLDHYESVLRESGFELPYVRRRIP
jgi:hypothetical protein